MLTGLRSTTAPPMAGLKSISRTPAPDMRQDVFIQAAGTLGTGSFWLTMR